MEDAVEKESKSIGLEREDALNRARWRVGVGEIAVRVGENPATPVYWDKPGSKLDWLMIRHFNKVLVDFNPNSKTKINYLCYLTNWPKEMIFRLGKDKFEFATFASLEDIAAGQVQVINHNYDGLSC